jgi:hypothetical protein
VFGLSLQAVARESGRRTATYSDCSEDILELVYEGNQPRVVHVDAVHLLAFRNARGYPKHVRTHLDLSPWSAKRVLRLFEYVQCSRLIVCMGVGGIKIVEGESVCNLGLLLAGCVAAASANVGESPSFDTPHDSAPRNATWGIPRYAYVTKLSDASQETCAQLL